MSRQNHAFPSGWQYTNSMLICLFLLVFNTAQAKDIIGRLENVSINHSGLVLQAKIDTGAKNSSIHATNYHLSRKEGEIWVKFDVTNKAGKTTTLEKPIVRFVKIKRKEASTQQRPAILLDICLGKTLKEVEVNLIDRSNFNYQMLIGRSFLHGDFIVDVDASFTGAPQC